MPDGGEVEHSASSCTVLVVVHGSNVGQQGHTLVNLLLLLAMFVLSCSSCIQNVKILKTG